MNIKRFHAPTSREALAKARMAFGEGTIILSNRPTATGVEVVATAEDMLSSLVPAPDEGGAGTGAASLGTGGPSAFELRAAASVPPQQQLQQQLQQAAPREMARPVRPVDNKTPVEEDTEQLAMSTLSFQDYVRERMLRRRHEVMHGGVSAETAFVPDPVPAPAQPAMPARAPAPRQNLSLATPPAPAAPRAKEASASLSQGIVSELQAMKDLIEDRFNTLAWLGQAKQDPIQSNLMLKLIRAGYSPALARAVLERLPEDMSAGDAVRWLMDVLERNLKTDMGSPALHEQGGIFALVGATGVGKTTTAAKLAALCARQYGPNSVGLITLDTYRVAAHDQLRAYGRMLGVVAHLAHDRAALQDLLGLLVNKKLVLIDTTGVAPRDPRKRELLDVLDLPKVNRLLVLNAGGHGDTLDDVLTSFKTQGVQQAVLSKVDEAVKLGPALDSVIRHQLVLRGVTNGQRVPEDWEAADAGKLVRLSMRSPAKSAFDPKAVDLSFFFSNAAVPSSGGLVDA